MRRWVTATALAASSVVLVACGGGSDEPRSKPAPTDPTPSATSPTTAPIDEEGAYGVTYRVRNADRYADDEAVVAYKKVIEALVGSSNRRTIVPELRRSVDKKTLRTFVANFKRPWKERWTLRSPVEAKVERARTKDSVARLDMCVWEPTNSYVDAKGDFVDPVEKQWTRQVATLEKTDGRWVLTGFRYDGTCRGGDPT